MIDFLCCVGGMLVGAWFINRVVLSDKRIEQIYRKAYKEEEERIAKRKRRGK